jgi:hypothetical protein
MLFKSIVFSKRAVLLQETEEKLSTDFIDENGIKQD